jgi:hypothetical protein
MIMIIEIILLIEIVRTAHRHKKLNTHIMVKTKYIPHLFKI